MKFIVIISFCIGSARSQVGCPRPAAGSVVRNPVEIESEHGVLETTFYFRTSLDTFQQTRYCFVTDEGILSPTLRVNPGDRVILHLRNEAGEASSAKRAMPGGCAAGALTPQSTNLHFHGFGIPPVCHQDDVLTTLIAPGDRPFDYRFRVPVNQTPGLYWYHPHPHGFTEGQVLGGASGAMIVNGLERFRPEALDWPQRVIVLRDQAQPGQQLNYLEADEDAEKDISINYVPVTAPLFAPAEFEMSAGKKELWRVLNASADTYFDLAIEGGKAGELELLAIDGAPVAQVSRRQKILIPPGGRAEFLVHVPVAAETMQLVTKGYDTGPDGTATPAHVLARLKPALKPEDVAFMESPGATPEKLEDLRELKPLRTRKIFLSEDREDLVNATATANYYITEEGAKPTAFDMMSDRPDITVQQGNVEDWVIENRAREAHTFHIHQLHFQVMERDGRKVEPLTMDTIDLPFWDGKSPYPSVKLRMDFRSPLIVGDFVYHCHILEHEDKGMMGRIRVVNAK
jgi:FtsP/CotA-like multicopper oxidase with cupredoxin domain